MVWSVTKCSKVLLTEPLNGTNGTNRSSKSKLKTFVNFANGDSDPAGSLMAV